MLKAAGKPEKVARIAAARKRLLIAHAIYNGGESFRSPRRNRQGVLQELRGTQHS